MSSRQITIGDATFGGGGPLALIAGPCVIEGVELALESAAALKEMSSRRGIPFVYKSSYDKANRSSHRSFRGPGLAKGLETLARVREEIGVPVLTDVHQVIDVEPVSQAVDVLQIPAFLCRQTDLVIAAARTGKPVNIKKGQFLSPPEMGNVIEKIADQGNNQILLTERGTMFGYGTLVVDFQGMSWMRETFGYPTIFDATHSVQEPGGLGNRSSGDRRLARNLARAAVAAGCDGVFLESHPDPDRALCDGPNMIPLGELPDLLDQLVAIDRALKRDGVQVAEG